MKRGIATLFASGVLLVALTGAAIAGPLDDAIAALRRGDYTMAMRLIRPLAEQGNAPRPPSARQSEVAIIGTVPIGLMTANLLGLAGIRVLVLERNAALLGLPRAIAYDAETLRLFMARKGDEGKSGSADLAARRGDGAYVCAQANCSRRESDRD